MPPELPRRSFLLLGGFAALFAGCTVVPPEHPPMTDPPGNPTASPSSSTPTPESSNPLRPVFHYTAAANQINDPNGLLWYDGEYHLFHQYNVQGAVHWGHAVSTDLLRWQRLDPALYPDQLGQIWSGSAVVDQSNTAGFQLGADPAFVALFTYSSHDGGEQSQGLAYSTDRGRSWTKYPGNPVIPNPGQKDFRDPKVLWHEPTEQWVMVLSEGDHVGFYTSPNLLEWERVGEFGRDAGAHGGSWECPDLFLMPLQDTDETRWVLSVSVFDGAPAGGSGMQYFVGDFDGSTFTNRNSNETTLWQNWGPDYYAGVTWGDSPFPTNRRLMIAWLDNWKYRDIVPTEDFNGQLALIRDVQLRRLPEGERLTQVPAPEYEQLRTPVTIDGVPGTIRDGEHTFDIATGSAFELHLTYRIASTSAAEFGVNVRQNGDQRTSVGYDLRRGEMYVDRGRAGVVPVRDGNTITDTWARRYSAPLAADSGLIHLRVFVDQSSVELFGNEREQVSCLVLPDIASTGISLYANGGAVELVNFEAFTLASIF